MSPLIQNLRTAVKLLAVVAILVVVNMAVDRYDRRWDLTEARLYTLSPRTQETLDGLSRDVTLFFFHTDQLQSGPADASMIRRLLRRYGDQSPRLDFREVDPTRNPNLAREYGIRENNAIVVSVGEKSSTINSFDLYEFQGRGRGRGPGRGQRQFRGESAITSALIKLTRGTDRTVYFSTGHGEYDRGPGRGRTASEWVGALEEDGYTVASVNPLVDELPDTGDLIVVLDPREGYSEDAAERLRGWYRRGGNLLVAGSPSAAEGVTALLKGTGLGLASRQILASRDRRPQMRPLLFTPKLEGHPAVRPLRDQGLTVLLGRAAPLETRGDTPRKILTTGPNACSKPLLGPEEDFQLTCSPVTGDEEGDFTVAASVPSEAGGRLVAVGSALTFGDRLLARAPGNRNLALNLVNWMLERQVSLEIAPVPLDYNRVQVSASQATTLQVVALILVPLGILVWGGTVWWTRRNR